MAEVRKRKMGNQDYYYLAHTIRVDGHIEKRERYLGKEIPKNIENLKKDFLQEIHTQQWHAPLDQIKKRFAIETKQTPPSAAEEELAKFAVQFTYDTQRIEGSTLTLRQTADLLEHGIAPAKPLRDIKEAEAHRELFNEMLQTKKDISFSLILDWHRRLFLTTRQDIAGKLRQHQVMISRSKFMPPTPVEVYPLIEDFLRWYDDNKKRVHPVELAALVHLKFVTIHPFSDGNGRISRLLMNFVLRKHNYPLLNIHYQGRDRYYTALERAQTKNQDYLFVRWLVKRYLKECARYLKN